MNFVEQYCDACIEPEIKELAHYVNDNRVPHPKNAKSLTEFISGLETHLQKFKDHLKEIEKLKDVKGVKTI